MKTKIFLIMLFSAAIYYIEIQADGNDNYQRAQCIWTWMAGSNERNPKGVYSEVAGMEQTPGGKNASVSWTDNVGNFYLFGGTGYDGNGNRGSLNDLWKFDGKKWIWISGSNLFKQKGVYVEKGVANPANIPGARYSSVACKDSRGNLYLFGGIGYNNDGQYGTLNDLWRFDGQNWVWMAGSKDIDQKGVYGNKGISESSNAPMARDGSFCWIDKEDSFWLFGGYGVSEQKNEFKYLNDLWKFDGKNWIWISGSNVFNQKGTYGEIGVAAAANIPGARGYGVSWTDSRGNFFLFGGGGFDNEGKNGLLNDLWKFDGKVWVWLAGSEKVENIGNYGIKGTASDTNIPGARYLSMGWIDKNNNLWLFGGTGYAKDDRPNPLNDLWMYDGKNWIWMSGSDRNSSGGAWGIKGIADVSNIPSARSGSSIWMDFHGNLWLFGGSAKGSDGLNGNLNDLWKCELVK